MFSGLAANIRKSIPFEVQSGFRPLPLSHHFKTKLKCQKSICKISRILFPLLHPLLRKSDDPRAEKLPRLFPGYETVEFFVIFESEFVTLQQDLLHAPRERFFVILVKF